MAKLELQDANAIVTGASRGIGPYIARELAARGMRVALVARSTHELEKLAADITASGAVAVPLAGDVTARDDRARGVSASTLILGPVGEAGVGARTADEVGLKLPPFLVSPARIGKATVRAIERDKAELTLMPGPGKLLRALMDRFPGMGPAM